MVIVYRIQTTDDRSQTTVKILEWVLTSRPPLLIYDENNLNNLNILNIKKNTPTSWYPVAGATFDVRPVQPE